MISDEFDFSHIVFGNDDSSSMSLHIHVKYSFYAGDNELDIDSIEIYNSLFENSTDLYEFIKFLDDQITDEIHILAIEIASKRMLELQKEVV
jgi:hypothetical protein